MEIIGLGLIFAFLIKIYFTFSNNSWFQYSVNSDEIGHMAHEISLKLNNRQSGQFFKNHFWNRSQNGYPSLFHNLIIFLFPNNSKLTTGRYLSGIFSLIPAIIFLIFGHHFFTQEELYFGTIPMLLGLANFGFILRQHKAYTARTFADFNIFLGFYFLLLYLENGNYYFVLGCLFFFVLIWFCSEFGIQTLIIIPIIWSCVSLTVIPILFSIGSFLIAMMINKKGLFNILNHKYAHWFWFYTNQNNVFKPIKFNKVFSFKGTYSFLMSHVFLGLLLQFIPYIIYFFYITLEGFRPNYYLDGFILASIVSSFLTVFKKFRFLGPSYRYSLYALPFIWIKFYQYDQSLASLFLLVEVLFSIVFSFFILKNLIKRKKIDSNELKDISNIVDKKGLNVLLSPFGLVNYFIVLNKKIDAKYLTFFDNDYDLEMHKFYNKYIEYPNIKLKPNLLNFIKEKFKINLFLIQKASYKNKSEFNYLKRLYAVEYESEKYLVINLQTTVVSNQDT